MTLLSKDSRFHGPIAQCPSALHMNVFLHVIASKSSPTGDNASSVGINVHVKETDGPTPTPYINSAHPSTMCYAP